MPGRKTSRQRLRVIHNTHFHCASSLAVFPSDRKSHDFPAHLCLPIIRAFYFTGCGLHCRKALLPRDRHSAPESAIFRTRHSTGASLCVAQSDKVTHDHHTAPCPCFQVPALIPISDTPFWGRCQQERGEKDRYRGGHDAPENPLLTQAARTAYWLKLPIPQQAATPA